MLEFGLRVWFMAAGYGQRRRARQRSEGLAIELGMIDEVHGDLPAYSMIRDTQGVAGVDSCALGWSKQNKQDMIKYVA